MANTGQDESKEHNRLGIALQARGRNVEAAQEYRKAIQVNSGCASCHNNLAVVLKELDKLEEAEREARLALRLKPGRADYLFNLGIILQQENKLELAEAELREAAGKQALDPEIRYRLSQVLMLLARPTDAEQEIKICIMLRQNEAKYHKLLGDSLLQQGRHDEALLEYRKVLEITPNPPDVGDLRNKIDYLRQIIKVH